MASKNELRAILSGNIKNTKSKKQEKTLVLSILRVWEAVEKSFPGVKLDHQSQIYLSEIVNILKRGFPKTAFKYYHDTSTMKPDGGILYLISKGGTKYPILISEKKRQGTNDNRATEGKKPQAKGNAIERLGKNVIGFRAALLHENIFPFICFGDGCDFDDTSSIIDRVATIAMFGELNKEHLHLESDRINRGSFYFRVSEWTEDEMYEHSLSIAEKSVFYYFSKYGKEHFI